MVENPYKSPPVSSDVHTNASDESRSKHAPSGTARWGSLAALLVATMIVSALVTPADPMSTTLAWILISTLVIATYYFGLQHGSHKR